MIGLPAALSLLIALTSPITARSIRNRHNPQSESQACTTNAECLQLGLPLKAPRYLSGRATNPIANVTFTCGQNADFKVDASFSGIYNYIVVGGSGGDATAAGTTGGHAAEVRGQVKIDRETLFIRPGCQGVSGQGGGGGGGASYTMYRTSFTAGNGHGIATAGGGGGAGTSASGVDASLEEYGTLDSAGTPFNERGQGLSNTGTGDYGGGGADEALPGGGEQGLNNGAGGESLSQDTDAIGTIGAGGLAAQSQISPQGTGGYGGGGGAGLTTVMGGGGGGYTRGGTGGSTLSPGVSTGGGGGGTYIPSDAIGTISTRTGDGYIYFELVKTVPVFVDSNKRK